MTKLDVNAEGMEVILAACSFFTATSAFAFWAGMLPRARLEVPRVRVLNADEKSDWQ